MHYFFIFCYHCHLCLGMSRLITLNASVISSNMAMVEVNILRDENHCYINGIIISIINEFDPTDCLVRIFANDYCDKLKNVRNSIYILLFNYYVCHFKNTQRTHRCSNVEFVKFNNQPQKIAFLSFFSRTFQTKYKMKAFKIFHQIDNATFSDVFLVRKSKGSCYFYSNYLNEITEFKRIVK